MSFRNLLRTDSDYSLTLVRLVLGFVFFAHGAQKALGWFGGHGYSATLNTFTEQMGIPVVFAVLAILAEFLGGIGVILGLLTRVAAFGITVNMAVAIALVHGNNGLFMNWQSNQRGEGFEFHLLVLAITTLLMVRGAGALSLDRLIESRLSGGTTYHIHMEPEASS
jgi:putative oxidoreductase